MSNNLENNSYVLAIPSDNISPIGSNPFYYEFNSKTLSGHGDIFKLFVLRYMININIPASDGYFWGKELADKGVFSVIKEDDEAYLFIPKTLTVKQADWLIENKEYLKLGTLYLKGTLGVSFVVVTVISSLNNTVDISISNDLQNLSTNSKMFFVFPFSNSETLLALL